jgi:hypothetical protein
MISSLDHKESSLHKEIFHMEWIQPNGLIRAIQTLLKVIQKWTLNMDTHLKDSQEDQQIRCLQDNILLNLEDILQICRDLQVQPAQIFQELDLILIQVLVMEVTFMQAATLIPPEMGHRIWTNLLTETTVRAIQRVQEVECKDIHQVKDHCILQNSSLLVRISHLKTMAGISRDRLQDIFLSKVNLSEEVLVEFHLRTSRACILVTCLQVDTHLTINSDHKSAQMDRWFLQE